MQRKNNILRSARSGIAMIMAIAVIVIIATLLALSLSLTSQTSKKSTDIYLHEQAALLAHSAAEYALLRISQDNNSTNPCNFTGANFTPDVDGDGNANNDLYDINISVRYIYTNFPATCNANQRYAIVTTSDENGSALLDITVSVNDTTVASEPIRYFKRTLQKL